MIVVGVVGTEEENLVQKEGITGIDNNKISSSSRIHSNNSSRSSRIFRGKLVSPSLLILLGLCLLDASSFGFS
jgi:hypothetical protein